MEIVTLTGRRAFGVGGGIWLPRMQVMHALKSVRRDYYDDNQHARLRQHVMLTGPKGTRKTTIMKWFLNRLIGGKNLLRMEDDPDGSCPVYVIAGSGVTWERMTGSISEDGTVLPPLITQVDYFVMPELMDWMKRGETFQERMEQMNVAMEEGTIERALVKFGAMENIGEVEEELARYRTILNRRNRTMSMDVKCSFAAATRPLKPAEWSMLVDSGCLDRMERGEWQPSKESMIAAWLEGPGFDPKGEETIAAFNAKMWKVKWGKIPYPPTEMLQPVIDHYHRFYLTLEKELGATPLVLRSFRDWNGAAQLLTAFAVMRTVQAHELEKERGTFIDELRYTTDDVKAASRFLDTHFAPIYDAWLERVNLDPKEKEDWDNLVNFAVATGNHQNFLGSELVEWYCGNVHTSKERTASVKTAYNFLARCKDRGWATASRYGEYTFSAETTEIVAMKRSSLGHIEGVDTPAVDLQEDEAET